MLPIFFFVLPLTYYRLMNKIIIRKTTSNFLKVCMQYHLTAKSVSGITYNSLITPEQATQHYIDLKMRVDKFGSCSKLQESILITMQRYKGE